MEEITIDMNCMTPAEFSKVAEEYHAKARRRADNFNASGNDSALKADKVANRGPDPETPKVLPANTGPKARNSISGAKTAPKAETGKTSAKTAPKAETDKTGAKPITSTGGAKTAPKAGNAYGGHPIGSLEAAMANTILHEEFFKMLKMLNLQDTGICSECMQSLIMNSRTPPKKCPHFKCLTSEKLAKEDKEKNKPKK